MPRRVKLESNEGEMFEIDWAVAAQSGTIRGIFCDLGLTEDAEDDDESIPLPNVTTAILRRVIEWCDQHRNDPLDAAKICDDPLIRKDYLTVDMPQWDLDFLEQGGSLESVFQIILAANYLDIQGLLDVCCKYIASMIKGRKPEEIRATFDIHNDFTEEEERLIREENQWCEEML